MRSVVFSGFFVFATVALVQAEPKWIHVPSSDFEIFSSAGESSTMQVLEHFEEVRSFFNESHGFSTGKSAEPVRIIVFGSEKEYLPYRPFESSAAFYTQVAGRDYIVLGSVSDNVFPIAVHEYVHLIAQHAQMNLPPWLNEGTAEVYSTLKPDGGKILVGSLIQGHIFEINQNKWVLLETILAVDHNSPYYNEKNKAGAFYAESWAFAHMLILNPAYSTRLKALFDALRAGTPSQQAVESVYGRPLATFNKEVQNYILGNQLTGRLIPAKLDGTSKGHAEPAQPFDVKLALLDLLEKPGREEERRKGLTGLAAEYPQRPEPHAALGYLDWRSSQSGEAVKEFKIALDLGGKNPKMLWDYGRLAASQNAADALRALQLLSSLEPGRVDVALTTAQIQLNAKKYQDVLTTLAPLRKVTPADAPVLFRTLALAYMNTGDSEEAGKCAQRWKDTAKEDSDRDGATRLIEYLNAVRAAKQNAVQAQALAAVANSVQPAAPSAEKPALRTGASRPSVAGTFVEFNCSQAKPRFVLKTQQGAVSFLMDDPQKVFIRGRGSGTVDLYCGAQKEASMVWIEYDPPPASEKDVRGVARIVRFEAPGTGDSAQ